MTEPNNQLSGPFDRAATRALHLAADNPLRALTAVIDAVDGGINLGQGVCDTDMPLPLAEGLQAAIESDRQVYTPYAGVPELRQAIAAAARERYGLPWEAANVSVTSGSSGAFTALGLTLFEPHDEVVLFEPFYSYHRTQIRLLGATPVAVPLQPGTWALDIDRLRSALTERTRAVVINTPANPTGKVFTVQELEAIAEALRPWPRCLVITDEVYEHMVFDGKQHVPPATLSGLAERTLTLSSYSKTFSITGWRVGYVGGPSDVIEQIGRSFDQMEVCVARPMQRAVTRAVQELPQSFYSELQASYEKKRNRFCRALTQGGFRFTQPEGAYYVLADYSAIWPTLDPHEAVLQMIENIGVNAVPGHLFHSDAAGVKTMRFHFAVDEAILDDACDRLASLGRR